MSRKAGESRVVIRALLKGLTASVAVALVISVALSTAMRDAASTTPVASAAMPVAPANTGDRAPAPRARVPDKRRASVVERDSDSQVIRDVFSDGGYWYWLERHPGGH
jgi:hypothetical protein